MYATAATLLELVAIASGSCRVWRFVASCLTDVRFVIICLLLVLPCIFVQEFAISFSEIFTVLLKPTRSFVLRLRLLLLLTGTLHSHLVGLLKSRLLLWLELIRRGLAGSHHILLLGGCSMI
jgi:hypothetical protein